MKKTRKNKKGFTLIELVVVIAILGILAAILIPVVGGFIKRANDAANDANAKNIFNTTTMYVATTDDAIVAGTYTGTQMIAIADFKQLFGGTWPDVKGITPGTFQVVIGAAVNDAYPISVIWSVNGVNYTHP